MEDQQLMFDEGGLGKYTDAARTRQSSEGREEMDECAGIVQ